MDAGKLFTPGSETNTDKRVRSQHKPNTGIAGVQGAGLKKTVLRESTREGTRINVPRGLVVALSRCVCLKSHANGAEERRKKWPEISGARKRTRYSGKPE